MPLARQEMMKHLVVKEVHQHIVAHLGRGRLQRFVDSDNRLPFRFACRRKTPVGPRIFDGMIGPQELRDVSGVEPDQN